MKIKKWALFGLIGMLSFSGVQGAPQDDQYVLGPDSLKQEGVPNGKIIPMDPWKSKIFDGTVRDWWLYVPAQYDGKTPAKVAIFQDGGKARPEDPKFAGPNNAAFVFDNLIHRKEIPVTIGIFISPGEFPDPNLKKGQKPRRNRSVEYDTPDDTYARFLLEEILPEVAKRYQLSNKPEDRMLIGNSSGGICAFTAAWFRPDQFQKVVSHIGSFVDLRGGYIYPPQIRKTHEKFSGNIYKTESEKVLLQQRRSIKVFLQDGINDLDNIAGNWPLANQDMAAALKYAGWNYKFVMGEGTHNSKHGASLFPETLRWMWSE